MPWISLLEPLCAFSEDKKTDTTLDQDSVLKATVLVCTACMDVSLLTTCMNFNTPPLVRIPPFLMQRLVKQNAEVPFNKETEKARLPTDSCLYNSKRPSLVNCILTIPECRSDHHGSCTITAWSCKRVCSLSVILARHCALKVVRQVERSVNLHDISYSLLLLLFAHCPCFAHCRHGPFIVRSTQT